MSNIQPTPTVNSYGIGFIPLLTLIFITLKLTGFIAWSWFWVLSPMIISTVLIIGLYGTIAYWLLTEKR
jgi:putative effector of murein hydrolase LrgA (UPF0299 family)